MTSDDEVLAALKIAPRTANQLAGALAQSRPWVSRVLSRLHAAGRVHVFSHFRSAGSRGPWAAVYAFGPGDDAEAPQRQSSAEYQRARRERGRLNDH